MDAAVPVEAVVLAPVWVPADVVAVVVCLALPVVTVEFTATDEITAVRVETDGKLEGESWMVDGNDWLVTAPPELV